MQWKARVLIVSAPVADDPQVAAQEAWLTEYPEGQAERELEVIRLTGDAADHELDACAVRERLSMSPDRFEVVLLGKDGGVALRRARAVTLLEVFERIDAMPMRREAMRRRTDPPAGS